MGSGLQVPPEEGTRARASGGLAVDLDLDGVGRADRPTGPVQVHGPAIVGGLEGQGGFLLLGGSFGSLGASAGEQEGCEEDRENGKAAHGVPFGSGLRFENRDMVGTMVPDPQQETGAPCKAPVTVPHRC